MSNRHHSFAEILFLDIVESGETLDPGVRALPPGITQTELSVLIYRSDRRRIRKMKKPVLSIEEPEPKKILRADRPPTEGFVTVVDGHFKSEFADVEAAEAAGRKLKAAYPMLQIEIYDAANRVRTLLGDEPGQSAGSGDQKS